MAEATDPEVDPDRRAWHRAHAAPGPTRTWPPSWSARPGRAQARGGVAAAAAFLERAAELTPDPARRAGGRWPRRRPSTQAGAPDAALGLLATAEPGPLDELQRARVDLLRAQIAFAPSRGSDAPPLLLRAARRLEPLDVELARETYLEALGRGDLRRPPRPSAAVLGGRPAPPVRRPRRPSRRRATDLLLDGLATAVHGGLRGGRARARAGAEALPPTRPSPEDELRWLWLAVPRRSGLWDDETLGRADHPPGPSSPAMPARSPCSRRARRTAPACTCYAGELDRGGRR